MNKTLLAIVGLVVVGIFLLLAFFLSPKTQPTSNGSPSGQTTDLPISPTVAPPSLTTVNPSGSSSNTMLTLTNVTGGPIQTTNFITDATTAKDPINSGYYYLGYHVNEGVPDATATTSPPYVITYISTTQYFNIAILQEPIGPIRIEAEQYLMAHLGISESQMCQLSYMVSVPDKVNSQFSGKNLGFSFCPGATTLPQ